jgi:AraC-like DNA-binding protein
MKTTKKSPVPPRILRAILFGAVCAVCVSGISGAYAQTVTPGPAPTLSRELIILRPGSGSSGGDMAQSAQADVTPEQPPRLKTVTADSAKIISPTPRSVLSDCPVVYEIEPMLPVDSALLFVRHSQGRIDTLAILSSPPYRATWNCASVPDQDQTHLQFGYVLYRGDSLAVVSPPLPHRWALFRGKQAAQMRSYRIKQLTTASDDFNVDCDTSKWSGVEGAGIVGGNTETTFKLLWTGAKLYFIALVRDNSVSGGDFVELHLDMHRDQAAFPGINHRSIRFSPRGRSAFFVGEFKDGKYVQSDSLTRLFKDEAEWKAFVNSDGYVVEAAIPFSILSDFDFPPSKIGFDVSVMDVNGQEESFYSWAGAERFTRYSPSRWGTARINDAAPALKYVLILALSISAFAIIGFVIYLVFSHRQESIELKAETKGVSPLTESVVEQIDKQLSNTELRISDIAKSVNIPAEKIVVALMNDLGCTFEQQLTYKRLKRSQKLMREPEITIEEIAKRCGFADVDTYRKSYAAQMKVDPEVSRKAMQERIREDMEAEREDDDDDDEGL